MSHSGDPSVRLCLTPAEYITSGVKARKKEEERLAENGVKRNIDSAGMAKSHGAPDQSGSEADGLIEYLGSDPFGTATVTNLELRQSGTGCNSTAAEKKNLEPEQ